jgi:hypothetical protein
MSPSFYTYFSSGYGTMWLALLAFSIVTNSHVDTGEFGLIGFPIMAAIYAFYRRKSDADKSRVDSQ